MGFAVPLANWFRGPLRQRLRHFLLEGHLTETGMFNRPFLEKLISDHQSGFRDHSAPLWSLLMFQAAIEEDQFTVG
jgi:asparagine synthase (glutamine-hydrolysing)